MTLKAIDNVKDINCHTTQALVDDLNRLITEMLIEPNKKLEDILVIYATQDGEMAYIGQTLKAVEPVKLVGVLEYIKQHILLNTIQLPLDDDHVC